MSHLSEDLARFEQQKHSLKSQLQRDELSAQRFVVAVHFSRGHLIEDKVSDRHFVNCTFENLQFIESEMSRCNFNGLRIHQSELRSVIFRDCSFRDLRIEESLLSKVRFENCFFENCDVDFSASELKLENCFIQENVAPKESRKEDAKAPVEKKAAAEAKPEKKGAAPAGRFGNLDLEQT